MGLRAFTLTKRPLLEFVLWILCLTCWSLGGFVYMYSIYESLTWTMMFPNPNLLAFAVWLMQFALRFFSLWVPVGFLLIYWRFKTRFVFLLYLTGCAAAILFGVLAAILIMPYLNMKVLRDQYFDLINKELKNGFPQTIKSTIQSHKCCSWYGPTDFGEVFNLTDKKDTDLGFMKEVAACYGGIFEVVQEGDNIVYSSQSKSRADVPKACGIIYKTAAARICNFIFFMDFFLIILTGVIAVLYVIIYKKQQKGQQVSPELSHPQPSYKGSKGGRAPDNLLSTESVPSSPSVA